MFNDETNNENGKEDESTDDFRIKFTNTQSVHGVSIDRLTQNGVDKLRRLNQDPVDYSTLNGVKNCGPSSALSLNDPDADRRIVDVAIAQDKLTSNSDLKYSEKNDEKCISKGDVEGNSTDSNVVDRDEKQSSEESTPSFSFRILTNTHKLILISVCLSNFLAFLCLSLIAPFFPEEAASKNVSDSISGWIFGVFAFTQFVSSPLAGHLIPILGLKFMYIGGLFLASGCTVLFGVLTYIDTTNSNVTFIIYCFVLRVFLALGCTSLQTASSALCAKEFPNAFSTVFGITEVFVGIGFMSGPAIGGFLYGSGGFVLPFAVIGAFMALCVPFNFWLIPVLKADEDQTQSKLTIWTLMKSHKSIINSLATVIAAMIFSILDPILEPHLNNTFGLDADIIGLLFLVMSAFYAITSPIAGTICDRVGDNRAVLIPGFLISVVGMLFIGPSSLIGLDVLVGDQLWLNIVCLIVLGIGASLALIPTFDVFIDVAGELGYEDDIGVYGIVAGVWGSFYAFGDFLGPSIGGVLLDIYGFSFCCSLTAAGCLFMVPLLAISWLYDTRCCRHGSWDAGIESSRSIGETTPLLGNTKDNDVMSTFPPPSTITVT